MENKLLPCPFCGGKALPDIGNQNGEEADQWFVMCQCCAAEGPWFYERGNAITAWNTRSLPEAVRLLIDAAKDARTVMDEMLDNNFSCFSDCAQWEKCSENGADCLILARLEAALAAVEG